MTVASTSSRIPYAGSGISTFSYPYEFKNLTDIGAALQVASTGVITALTYGVDYTVAGTQDPVTGFYLTGGTVTTTVAVPVGTNIVLWRNTPALQGLSVTQAGNFPSKPFEAALDNLALATQRAVDLAARSMHLPDGFATTFDTTIPSNLGVNPNCAIVSNASGNGFAVGPTADQIAQAQTYANNSAASATASAGSATASANSATASANSAAQSAASAAGVTYVYAGDAGGTADALTITPSPAITSYVAGYRFAFRATATNATTTPTLAVSGLAVKTLVNQGGTALAAGDITSGRIYNITYNGTLGKFVVMDVPADASIGSGKLGALSVARSNLQTGAVANSAITGTPKTSTYTFSAATDDTILGDTSGGTFPFVLPDATTCQGKTFYWMKTDSSANALSLNTTSAQTVGGFASGNIALSLQFQNDMMGVESDGANWKIIARVSSQQDTVLFSTYTALASTNTGVVRFTTMTSVGASLTGAQSATNGDSVTVNKAGIYEVYGHYESDTTNDNWTAGITLNSTQLTVGYDSVTTQAQKLCGTFMNKTGAHRHSAGFTRIKRLAVGDVIRLQADTKVPNTAANCRFEVTRIGD